MSASFLFKPRRDYADFNLISGFEFADRVTPARFPKMKLRFWNDRWADRIGLGELTTIEKTATFASFQPLAGFQPEALAMRYHGHQFRHYNPDLGDGRGFLFGQCEDPIDDRLLDFGTKGSGQTPWSRAGDGRLTLKGAVREALASEMLEALGVATSKTFCFFETGENLERGDEPSPTRSAVLTRLSHGHIRFGTFQRLAALGESSRLRELVDYSIQSYFPALAAVTNEERHFLFLECVVQRSAELAASWMIAGFVHGVLNTDNMNITGESFDYGPWRFLPVYDPAFTAAYFDREGLYSYGRQPEAVYWNLDQLARALAAMVPAGREKEWQDRFVLILAKFPELFQTALLKKFLGRLGLEELTDEKRAEEIFVAAFSVMREVKVPFEQFFYDWYGGRIHRDADSSHGSVDYDSPACLIFATMLQERMASGEVRARMQTESILRTDYYRRGFPESMVIEDVESIWSAIEAGDDWSSFHAKIEAVRKRGRLHGIEI